MMRGSHNLEAATRLLRGHRIVALTGAGISTESGIPDYRGPETLRRARNPIPYSKFVKDKASRQRYWARSVIGWQRVSRARPNAAHDALARLEKAGLVAGVITQNIDRLHTAAGSERVVELHGALAEVRCLECGYIEERAALQRRLLDLNPKWGDTNVEPAPDGDAELDTGIAEFEVADCYSCAGTLKPNIVFFGENVPAVTVDRAWRLFDEGGVILVIGSSLTVFSGFRFVRRAADRGVPIVIINLGPTRGDPLASTRIDAKAGDAVPALANALLDRG